MKFTAEELERLFRSAASLRISRKNREVNKDLENDAGYWTGGRCNWGGSHSLKEDCVTLSRGLNKIEDLKNSEKELRQCTSEQEFNSTKSRLIRKIEELERDLQAKTGSSSSMFGICIIWYDFPDFIESRLTILRNELTRFKENISNQKYKHYEELRLLKLEQRKIEARMKENKTKAQNEKDPSQKALLLQMIEDDGKNLEENLKKQKLIPTANLKFEPDKYVSDLIKSMRKAIENSGNKKRKSSDSDSDEGEHENNSNNSTNTSNSFENTDPDWFSQNQPLIIFSAITLLIIFYFYTHQEEEPNYYDF